METIKILDYEHDNNKKYRIYKLSYNDEVVYVGRTTATLRKRVKSSQHYIKVLGEEIYHNSVAEVIEQTDDKYRERHWILFYREEFELYNSNNADRTKEQADVLKKEHYENNKKWFREKSKRYYEANKEYVIERTKKWFKDNPEKRKNYNKKNYENNKEVCLKVMKKYQEDNKEQQQAYRKEYYKEYYKDPKNVEARRLRQKKYNDKRKKNKETNNEV